MARYQCYWVEPTLTAKVFLRRFRTGSKCSGPMSYHNAMVQIEDRPVEEYVNYPGVYRLKDTNMPGREAPWPTKCEGCDYVFDILDTWQVFERQYYRRPDTGATFTLEEAEPGAMWDAKWWRDHHGRGPGPDGLSLHVKLPDGSYWFIDGPAGNCTMHDVKHNCWVREGTPPKLTVLGGANICGVGAGSIMTSHYHGFLRDGWLED